MSEQPTQAEQPESAEPTQEPSQPEGTLSEEAGKAIGDESPKADLAQELSPEQLKHVQAEISRAIDGAKRKWTEEEQKRITERGYLSKEQVDAIVEEKVQIREERAKAEANVKLWLQENGVKPDSDEAKKVLNEYRDGLEAGRYTNKMLLDKKGVSYLVVAAGLKPTSAQEDDLQLPRKSVPVPTRAVDEDGKPLTRQQMDAQIRERNIEAIKRHAARR